MDTPSIPDSHLDLLARPLFAHLATIRPDGTPQVGPMWVDWDGEFLRLTSSRQAYRFRNLSANRSVAVSVLDPDKPRRYLEMGGVVERTEPDPEGVFFMWLARRYGQAQTGPPSDAEHRVVIYIHPTRVVARTDQGCPHLARPGLGSGEPVRARTQ